MSDVPAEAVGVIHSFLDASQRNDMAAMSACLTRQSLESGQLHGSPEGVRFVVDETHMEGATAIVTISGFPLEAPADAPAVIQMPCMVVQEEGQWKFDIGATMDRMMGPQLEAAMQQVADGMGQALEKVGQALTTALGGDDASGEYDPAWDQASLTPEADELFPLGELTVLPKTTLAVTYAIGTDVPVEIVMGELLPNIPPDQYAEMVNKMVAWFDGSFFAGWRTIFDGVVAGGVPLRNRLRSVRIEEAKQCEDRIIVLDGSDLVYRLNPANAEGYFSDEYVAALLPGVLAGLPERINSTVTGNRVLPRDDERPTPQFYRERWVPRWMRRIGALLGKPIGLELDWKQAADSNNVGPQLPRWGLNRVYGALAFACLDDSRKEELTRDLKTVEIAVGYDVTKRFAKYEDGKLSVGLCYYGGDTPGCYEHEIAGALAGEPVE